MKTDCDCIEKKVISEVCLVCPVLLAALWALMSAISHYSELTSVSMGG